MTLNIFISDTAQAALQEATAVLVEHFKQEQGETYSPEAMQKAVLSWFESTLEDLATETLYHCVEGDRSFAVGRRHFERALDLAQPVSGTQPASSTIAA